MSGATVGVCVYACVCGVCGVWSLQEQSSVVFQISMKSIKLLNTTILLYHPIPSHPIQSNPI